MAGLNTEGCGRMDTYLCPAYAYVDGTFVYTGRYPVEKVRSVFYCALV